MTGGNFPTQQTHVNRASVVVPYVAPREQFRPRNLRHPLSGGGMFGMGWIGGPASISKRYETAMAIPLGPRVLSKRYKSDPDVCRGFSSAWRCLMMGGGIDSHDMIRTVPNRSA